MLPLGTGHSAYGSAAGAICRPTKAEAEQRDLNFSLAQGDSRQAPEGLGHPL